MKRRITAAALFVALAAGCGSTGTGAMAGGGGGGGGKLPRSLRSADGPGALFLSGSGSDTAPAIRRFRDLAGGRDAAIVIVPFAGGPSAGAPYEKAFRDQGVADVTVVSQDAKDQAAGLDALSRADGVYMVGGFTRILVDRVKPFSAAIRDVWSLGAVVGGHSAGAMVTADPVIVAGEVPEALAHGVGEGGLELEGGLGLLPGVIVDTHFGERGRFPRLLVAAGATASLGIGVDPGTIAVVGPDGTLTAYGDGAVTLIEPSRGGEARVTVLGDAGTAKLADWKPE